MNNQNDLMQFVKDNGFSLGTSPNLDDFKDNLYFFPKQIKETVVKKSEDRMRLDNKACIVNEPIRCIVCNLELCMTDEDNRKHLYNCLQLRGNLDNSNQPRNDIIGKSSKRKGSRVKRLANHDVLSVVSGHEEIIPASSSPKKKCGDDSPKKKSEAKENFRILKENLSEWNDIRIAELFSDVPQKSTDKKQRIRRQKQKEKFDEVCPYCFNYFTNREKQYNIHIAKCFEKFTTDVPTNYTRTKRVTSKPYFFQPEDYDNFR